MVEADVAELQQLFNSVEAKSGHERGPEAGRNKVEEPDGPRGGSLAGPAGAEEAIRNMADARRRTIKTVYEDPRTGFGSIAQTLQQAQVRDPSISKKAFLDGRASHTPSCWWPSMC